MLIAILDFRTDAGERGTALARLDAERDRVRDMPGNVAFRVYTSREDQHTVTLVHEWDDEESFGGYLGSDSFAQLGAALRPLVTGRPVSRRFRAELLATVG